MSQPSIEQRLVAVETAVRDLQHLLANAPPTSNWLERITGSFKDNPAFDEVVKYGRQWREANRLPEASEDPA